MSTTRLFLGPAPEPAGADATGAILDRLRADLPAMGITRVGHIGGLDIFGLPVAQAVRPQSRSLSVAQGKGATRSAAEVSAILEAAETWHAERIRLPMAVGTYRDLAERVACPSLASLPVYAGLAARPDQTYKWLLARDIGRGDDDQMLVPYDMVHTCFTPEHTDSTSPFYRSTSGLAAGFVRDRTTVHAICEVVERDATARFMRGETEARTIRHEAIEDDTCLDLLRRAAEFGLGCALSELPHPTGMPVARAVISGDGGRLQGSQAQFGGYGCALSFQEAIQRALFEAVQSRLTVISGAREDLDRVAYTRRNKQTSSETTPTTGPLPPPFEPPEDLHLSDILQRLDTAGYKHVLAVDLAREETDICVLRVVIPGMDISVHPGDCAPVRL